MPVAKVKHEHWHPPDYHPKRDVYAIQAITNYAAGLRTDPPSPEDCKRAFDWIINVAAGTYDEPFRPGEQDAVNYMLGSRSVGLATPKRIRRLARQTTRETGR